MNLLTSLTERADRHYLQKVNSSQAQSPDGQSARLPRSRRQSKVANTKGKPCFITPRTKLIVFGGQVEPTEKPKSANGRAHKRVIYTRRYVNITMTGGKRKVRCYCERDMEALN